MDNHYDVIIVGSGFSGAFFLHGYLPKAKPNAKILVIERGPKKSHQWRLDNYRFSTIKFDETFINLTPNKHWNYTPVFGGSSIAWWACTPRFMPNDFKMRSVYGVAEDWPVTYEQLEPYYTQAEKIMAVSGPEDAPYPRSEPYPQSAHVFSEPDKILKKAYPDLYFQQASARPRRSTEKRPMCCGMAVCGLCPIDSKFTVQNEMAEVFADPRVTLWLETEALAVEIANQQATGVRYRRAGEEKVAKGDFVVLGGNAIFNPHLLLRSGLQHRLLGKRLHEQVSRTVKVYLDGVDNYQSSTSISANGYMLYDGPHRTERSGALIEVSNIPVLRPEKNRWRQLMQMKFIFEDIPDEKNYVAVSQNNPERPIVAYHGVSDYTQRGLDHLPTVAEKILSPLPIESLEVKDPSRGEAHILGTTVMGNDADQSIVDKHLLHHQVRNLMVLGSSVYPSCSPSNPTLTLSALTLWAVDHL